MEKNKINEEVEKTLASIEGTERVEVDDFFYVRLKARLARSAKEPKVAWSFFGRPAISLSVMLIAFIVNVFVVVRLLNDKKDTDNTEASIQQFAKEYDIAIYTVYDNKTNN